MKKNEKLRILCEIEGYDDPIKMCMDAEFGMAPGIPAICCNPDDPECYYAENMEPDQNRGWCPECQANTLKSAYILMGVI